MFHTIITLAYVIPNIYVFLRIWKVFINKGYRFYYTLIYVFFVSIYPVSNLFNESNTGFIREILTITANYLLPFYLYLFLSVLLFDIFLLMNFIFKVVPAEKLQTLRFKKCGLSLILLIAFLILIAGIINFNTIKASNYTIEVPAKRSGIESLKIAFVADFHLEEGTSIKFVERFAKNIEIYKPDIMIFGGDIVEGDRDDEDMSRFEEILRNIKTRYGVYAVLGNHEYYAGQDKGSFFDRSGIKVLCDTFMVFDSSFILAGRYDSHLRGRKIVEELLAPVPGNLPLILVDHRPTEIEQVSLTGADIQVSGHTHNGQMFPINLITKKVYLLSWGYRKILNTHFFVTSGIRLWGPPVRTTGKSEIMMINVIFK
jgi:predicted MPP superfamily phosphohydrolase